MATGTDTYGTFGVPLLPATGFTITQRAASTDIDLATLKRGPSSTASWLALQDSDAAVCDHQERGRGVARSDHAPDDGTCERRNVRCFSQFLAKDCGLQFNGSTDSQDDKCAYENLWAADGCIAGIRQLNRRGTVKAVPRWGEYEDLH
jgi:hypothetical protein